MPTENINQTVEHCLGETSTDEFLSQYWQKKPLLVRNAFPGLQSPLSAEELAGLACEEHVNARIVLQQQDDKQWQVEFGPFDESRFSQLPETGWSLLVSDVDRHLPETQSLLKPFRFIPDWRIDDLMISYAPTGGSVGAHTDAYDVFLIQLSGQRLWKISENFTNETLNDTDLCILKSFTAEQEWVLNPGDMLYLPPNVAHHGIARQDDSGTNQHCMTASVGFRAPSLKTMTSDYVHFINEHSDSTARYRDRNPQVSAHHAEITEATVKHFIEELKQGLTLDKEHVKRWLGQYCSDNKAFEDFANEPGDIDFDELKEIAEQTGLSQSPYSNFLFSKSGSGALLFVDGDSFEVSHAFAALLCQENEINWQQLNSIMTSGDKDILLALFNDGSIVSYQE